MGLSLIQSLLILTSLCPQFLLADNAFKSCLKTAVGGDSDRLAFPGFPNLFYDATDVKRYNLYYNIEPAAISYPESAQEVGKLVKCAAQNSVKVQARSGGHSFGDYCMSPPDSTSNGFNIAKVSAENLVI